MLARLLPSSVLVLALAACGVGPRPERADASTLPRRELDAEATAQLGALVERAIAAVALLRYDEAGVAAEEALDIDPRSARARAVLAMVTLKSSRATDPPEAAALAAGEVQMRLAQQLAPDDPFVGWMHAVFLAESGHLSAAAAIAEQALARAADAPAAARVALLRIAGSYRYELGEERAAVPHLQQYVALRPDDAVARFHLGSALLRLAASPSPGVPQTSLLVAQRQAEEAARSFVRHQELLPQDPESAIAVVTAYLRAAELAAERAKLVSDAADRADERRQVTNEARDNRQAAEAALRSALDRFPTSPAVQFEAGVVAESEGDAARAQSCYQRALDQDPSHVPSLLNLAGCLARGGEQAAAAALLRRVLDVPTVGRELTADERDRIEAWLRGS